MMFGGVGGADTESSHTPDEDFFILAEGSECGEVNRRETIIFEDQTAPKSAATVECDDLLSIKTNLTTTDDAAAVDLAETAATAVDVAVRPPLSNETSSKPSECAGTSVAVAATAKSNHYRSKSNFSSSNLACEVASLSSLYSNYSQFDFSTTTTRPSAPSPPLVIQQAQHQHATSTFIVNNSSSISTAGTKLTSQSIVNNNNNNTNAQNKSTSNGFATFLG
jgi:hypothetical protein